MGLCYTLNTRVCLVRSLLAVTLAMGVYSATGLLAKDSSEVDDSVIRDRLRGMLIGSILGDAAGGPVEFQAFDQVLAAYPQFKRWSAGEQLGPAEREARAAAFVLDSYEALRPNPEPYAHWATAAPAGTATDDTRHKILVMNALRKVQAENRWPLTAVDVARAYVDYSQTAFIRNRPGYTKLAADWLEEYQLAARWVLGERDPAKAKPLSRLWGGLATNAGQMALLPLAGLFPGDPEGAYRLAYEVGFMDVGTAKDINASLVAGLAVCLGRSDEAPPSAAELDRLLFDSVVAADPYGYGKVPWTERRTAYWLALAARTADEARGKPARLFEILNQKLADDIKWEAHVPLVVAFAVMRCCRYNPLASLQTCLEFGHDTDSYAQLIGAYLGSVYGASIFPEAIANEITARFRADYGVDVDSWVERLMVMRPAN